MHRSTAVVAAVAALGVVHFASRFAAAQAVPIYATDYTGATGGNWGIAGNWSNGAPSATANATINNGATLPGLYPMNAETKARYAAFKAKG